MATCWKCGKESNETECFSCLSTFISDGFEEKMQDKTVAWIDFKNIDLDKIKTKEDAISLIKAFINNSRGSKSGFPSKLQKSYDYLTFKKFMKT